MIDSDSYMNEMRSIVQSGKAVSIIVSGNSMSPFLVNSRDIIYIEPISSGLKKGDMCFFQRRDGRFIMHRICKVVEEQYWFIGDAQPIIEGPISLEQIWGIVTKAKRKGKWIRKGDFWWNFFECVWINIIPLRLPLIKLYNCLTH